MLVALDKQAIGENLMVDKATYSAHDYDNEDTSMSINIVDITGANHDAQTALIGTLRTAMLPLMKGGWDKSLLGEILFNTPVPNTDPYAQREIKWAIVVQPTVGDPYLGNEMPMANLDLLANGSKYIIKNGDIVVPDVGGDIAAFVAAYEAVALSNSGQEIIIKDMYQVGRNI